MLLLSEIGLFPSYIYNYYNRMEIIQFPSISAEGLAAECPNGIMIGRSPKEKIVAVGNKGAKKQGVEI